MVPDVHARDLGEPTIKLRVERFTLLTQALGCETEAARAQLIGVDPKTLWRARAGLVVGQEFMAKTITSLRPYEDELRRKGFAVSLDELFEIDAQAAA